MKNFILYFCVFTLCCFGLFSFSVSAAENPAAAKLKVVATIFPVYDFVRSVGGDRVAPEMLARPGSEIHLFDPSPADVIKIRSCDLFVQIGGESDVMVGRVLASIKDKKFSVLRLMEHVVVLEEELAEGMEAAEEKHTHGDHDDDHDDHDDDDGDEGHNHHGDHKSVATAAAIECDEHIWTSPRNAAKMVAAIRDALRAADPAGAATYDANAAALIAELSQLDADFAALFKGAASSAPKRIVVADRFPFLYFAKTYGLDYTAAFAGCDTQSDASAATLAHIIRVVKAEKIPVVYALEMSSRNVANAVAKQTGCGVALLHSCHNVTAAELRAGASYVSLMRANLETLSKQFGAAK